LDIRRAENARLPLAAAGIRGGVTGASVPLVPLLNLAASRPDRSPPSTVPMPSTDASLCMKYLPFVLSIIAGSTDVIGFLGLGGLFTAHITGNLVILAARVVDGNPAPLTYVLSVPVFMVALGLTRLFACSVERLRVPSLTPLLLLQLLLLGTFLAIGSTAGPRIDPNAPMLILAGMLGVSAMAVQNALVRISLKGAPSTAVMTTNITLFTLDVGEMLLARDSSEIIKARRRAKQTWPAIAGFLLGCVLGGSGEALIGLRWLVLPAGLAAVALALGIAANLNAVDGSAFIHKEKSL
jgi:uncharacterized membrane protein YoaK (UPF0700 family)